MANRTLGQPPAGTFLPEPKAVQTEDGKLSEQSVSYIFSALSAIIRKINGGLSLGNGLQSSQAGNLSAQTVNVVAPSVADTEFEVPHGLGRVVQHVLVTRKDRACDIYDSNAGSWNDSRVLLKCSAASALVRLILS